MIVTDELNGRSQRWSVDALTHAVCSGLLIEWLEQHVGLRNIRAVGHRVVHGGPKYSRPEPVTPELLEELRRISPYDPEHMPAEIGFIESFTGCCPDVPHVACFDTAFHRGHAPHTDCYALPRAFYESGIRRYHETVEEALRAVN